MIPRKISTKLKKAKKSILLIGPRQAGKSTLIKSHKPDMSINLMHEETYLNFAANPKELEQRINANNPASVLIDEVQRIPSLLNTIQYLIDEVPTSPKFYLTGSSARKLRRGNANLLPGRIYAYNIGPLCSAELNYELPENIISYGSLPGVYTEPNQSDREKLLSTYTGVYLKEEIQAEALTKNLEGFARFLFVAAAECTKFLDLAKLANQAQIERHSAVRWFEILEDTLLVHKVPSYSKSNRKRLVQHPRYFLFDNGILNALLRNFKCSEDRIGMLFENLFYSQLKTSSYALDKEIDISNYRTEHGAEIDFIVEIEGKTWAIECKSSKNITKVNKKPFESFAEVCKADFHPAIAYLGNESKRVSGIDVLPWQVLLKKIGL